MMELVEQHEYVVAWIVYCLAGIGCMVVWWKITSRLPTRGVRDLLRGIAIILIFTPWYSGDGSDIFAPAFIVFIMDVFFDGAGGGIKSGAALLVGIIMVLIFLVVREMRRKA